MPIDPIHIPINDELNRTPPPDIQEDGSAVVPMDDEEESPQDVQELEDGSAIVLDKEEKEERSRASNDFYDNLAELMSDTELSLLATDYLLLIERDLEARAKRDEQYEEGIRRTGLGNDAPGGAAFSGASKTVHPVLAEACVDFEAAAIKELFPPIGPVKTQIIGEASEKDLDRAERKRQYMNWQLTRQMPEYRPELERLLSQLPLGGSQYQKFRWDHQLKRPVSEFVPVDNMILPFSASSFYTAQRQTHRMYLTRQEFEERIDSGMYLEVNLLTPNSAPDVSKAAEATRKVEGVDEDAYNEDGLRTVYEVHTRLRLDFDKDELLPYVMAIDEFTERVVAVYRNWDPEDEKCEKLDWFVDWPFIVWRGVMGIGLPHLIGGLAAALTGALRALLDSAHIANAATLVKLKGGRLVGQTTEVAVTEIKEIDAPSGIDDIRKVMMAIPFPGPSPVLFQLLGWLTEAAKGVVTTSEEKIADAGANMPVGTAMALIESGSKVFSAIHSRLHFAQAKALEILHRLNGQHLDEHVEVKELGKLVVGRADFRGPMDIIPVSDPAIFSESQRFAQIQALMQMSGSDAQDPSIPWNKIEIRRRMMHLMHVEDPDKLLPKPKDPMTADPVTENMAAMEGQTLKATQPQDHMAHLITHLQFILSPIHQLDSAPNPNLGNIMGHCREHLLLLYHQIAAQGTAGILRTQLPQRQGALQFGAPQTQDDAESDQSDQPAPEDNLSGAPVGAVLQ